MNEQTQVQVPSEPDGNATVGYPFSVLRVLGTALRVTKGNLIPFLVLGCLLGVPSFLLQRVSGGIGLDLLSVFVLNSIANALMTAVVVYGVIMELHGSRPSARACIAIGFRHLGPVIGVTLVSTLAICGAALLLLIPGLVVSLMLYVVVPVTIVEGLGVRAAMKRSRELTAGRKGDLFLIVILALGVGVAIELFAHYELGREAAFVWRAFGGSLSSMFFAVTVAVAYVELRKLRDGTQVPELATAVARFRH